ncbi:hypothetical protein SAMN05192589_1493, partial [Paracidovorax valerianellae]
LANQYDVVGDTSPSVVSNSQWHYGQDVRIGIEDQPLYRGGNIKGGTCQRKRAKAGNHRFAIKKEAIKAMITKA